MARVFKWIFGIFGLLLLFLLVAAVIVMLVVEPDDFKAPLAAKVKELTGRDLRIDQPIDLKLFPWLGLKLGGVSLSNAPGFGDAPMAEIGALELRVGIKPLLQQRLAVDTVLLQGLRLKLGRDARGNSNWDDLLRGGTAPAAGSGTGKGAGGSADSAEFSFHINGIVIEDASLAWDDERAGQHYQLTDVNLETGRIEAGEAVPVRLGLSLKDARGLDVRTALAGDFRIDPAAPGLTISGLALELDAKGSDIPGGGVELKGAADLALDLAAGTLKVQDLSLNGAGVKLAGGIDGKGINAEPDIESDLQLDIADLRGLLAKLGMEMVTTDPQVLQRISGEFSLQASANQLRLKPLQLQLDESRLSGWIELPSFTGPVVRGEMQLDQIDLDRYLPPPAEGQSATAPPPATPGQPAGKPEDSLAGLRPLDLDFSFRVGQLKVSNLKLHDILVRARSKGGQLNLEPVQGGLYQGKLNGRVGLDARTPESKLSIKQELSGVQIGPLLADLAGYDRLVGTGMVSIDLTTQGLEPERAKANLNGNLGIKLADGAYKGVNLAELIRNAQAALGGGRQLVESGSPQTDFSEFTATARVDHGVVQNEDLLAKSPLLRVAGKGKVDLPNNQIDYLVETTLVSSLEGQGGKTRDELTGVPIPVRIHGALEQPKYSIDPQALLSAKARQQLDSKTQELQGKAGKKIEDVVGDKLKGLFGK